MASKESKSEHFACSTSGQQVFQLARHLALGNMLQYSPIRTHLYIHPMHPAEAISELRRVSGMQLLDAGQVFYTIVSMAVV